MALLQLSVMASADCDMALNRARMQGLAGWSSWARRAVQGGASAGHKWARPIIANNTVSAMGDGALDRPFMQADRELGKWASI